MAKSILVACEFSGIVRDAFAAVGWDAWSCDLLPSERPGNHIQGDAVEAMGYDYFSSPMYSLDGIRCALVEGQGS